MWLGLSKIGVITALINNHLRKETLLHSINVASSKAIIVSAEMLDALSEIMTDEAVRKLHIFVYDTQNDEVKQLNSQTVSLNRELKSVSAKAVDISSNLAKDKLFYIYTSGTTGKPNIGLRKNSVCTYNSILGMPKAAVITNLRFQFMVSGVFKMLGMEESEIVYNTLPLYHTGTFAVDS